MFFFLRSTGRSGTLKCKKKIVQFIPFISRRYFTASECRLQARWRRGGASINCDAAACCLRRCRGPNYAEPAGAFCSSSAKERRLFRCCRCCIITLTDCCCRARNSTFLPVFPICGRVWCAPTCPIGVLQLATPDPLPPGEGGDPHVAWTNEPLCLL